MIKTFYLFLPFMSLIIINSDVQAAPGQTSISKADQKNLNDLKPTLKEILNVDPVQVPWGVNLDLVEERGKQARQKSLDKYDFSSRITLLQKHKTKTQSLTTERDTLKEKLKTVKDQIADLEQKMKNNKEVMEKLIKTVKAQTGLRSKQIDKLPDYDSWKNRTSPTQLPR